MFKNLSVVIFGQRYNDGPPPLCIRLQGQVLNNIAFALIVSMFAKCLVIGGSFFFILLTLVLVFFSFVQFDPVNLCTSYLPNSKRPERGLPSLYATACKWRWISSFAGIVSASIENWCGPRSSLEWLSSGFQTGQCTSTFSWCKQVKNTCRQNRSRHA